MSETSLTPIVHVAVGIIVATDGAVLISQRPQGVHQGGLWEFPGGKVEADETVEAALQRELHEELGIVVQTAQPLLQVHHSYADKAVCLDVWNITAYQGMPYGREGQPLAWVQPSALIERDFPTADVPIIAYLQRTSSR